MIENTQNIAQYTFHIDAQRITHKHTHGHTQTYYTLPTTTRTPTCRHYTFHIARYTPYAYTKTVYIGVYKRRVMSLHTLHLTDDALYTDTEVTHYTTCITPYTIHVATHTVHVTYTFTHKHMTRYTLHVTLYRLHATHTTRISILHTLHT